MKVEILEADHEYLNGTVGQVAPKGAGYQLDPVNFGVLIPATGTTGYQLEYDVLSVADWQTEQLARNAAPELAAYFKPPYQVGQTVSVRRVTRMIAEGIDIFLTSGTGALSTGTAVNTALGYSAGQLRVKQGGDEVAFILRKQLTPEVSTNVLRLELERP